MGKKFGKIAKITLLVCLCATLVLATVACDLFGGGSTEDNRNNIVKPNISKAQQDYDALSTKASDVTASATVAFFNRNAKKEVVSTEITENLSLKRIRSGNKFFAEAELTTTDCDDSIVALYKQIRQLVSTEDKPYSSTDDPVAEYLEKSSSLSVALGYENCYNLSAEYVSKKSPAKRRYAFDDKAISDCLDGESDFVLSSYLTASGIFDLKNAADWVSEDKASRFFSTDRNRFIYQLKADENKIKTIVINKIDKVLSLFLNENISDDAYEKILKFISEWIKVNPTSVDALVSDKGLPDSTTVNFSFDINVDFAELDSLLFLAFGKDKKEEISGYVNALATLKSVCGTNGENRTLGIRVTINEKENFFYDAKKCSFPTEAEEMFLPLGEEVADRKVITADDIKTAFSDIITLIFGEADKAETEESN